ncbi:MAG: STT3 domain-containing protein, partial [archaeon]
PTYSIVLLCKINPFCQSNFDGVKAASKWYAPLFTLLTAIVLIYLGYRAGRDWFVGALLFIIVPGALFRSVAGFSDKDTAAFFFMILSLYFVYRYISEESAISALIYGAFAGISMGLAALSLSAYILYVAPVLFFEVLQVFRHKISKSLFGTLPFALLPVAMRFRYGNTGGLSFATSTINLAIYGVLAFLAISYFVFRFRSRLKFLHGKQNEKEYLLAISLALTAISGLAGLLVMGISPVNMAASVFSQFTNPLRASVHGTTVGENQPTSWAWPWEAAFPLGGNSYWGQMGAIFPISLAIVAILFISGKDEDLLTALLLAFNIYAASRGVRLFVNLVPIAAFAAGQAISFIFHSGKKTAFLISGAAAIIATAPFVFMSKESVLTYLFLVAAAGLVIWGIFSKAFSHHAAKWTAALLVLLMFVQLYPVTSRESSGVHTSVSSEWFENFKWSDQNLAKESPILAWWDYGYWIQYFARRPSVADGGNRLLKMDQELGLMFTDNDENRAADWMTTLQYPIVTLTLSKGDNSFEYSNEVFAREFYANFVPEKTLVSGMCESGERIPKLCSAFSIGPGSAIPAGEYSAELIVDYRGVYSGLKGKVTVPEMRIEEMESVSISGPTVQDLRDKGDDTEIIPFIEANSSIGKLVFGYAPVEIKIPAPRIMTHDATMIGKMAAASSIGGRPVQYVVFPFSKEAETPLGTAQIYASNPYFIALVNQNQTTLPLIGVSGQSGAMALSSIVTYNGIYSTNTTLPKDPGSAIIVGGAVVYVTEGGAGNIFTRTYLLDGAGTSRFREVFSNGFAKSFYVI